MDAPYYNGGPDDGYRSGSTGPRREAPAPESPRGGPCHHCQRPIHRVYTLAGVGAFCSPGCRAKGMETTAKSEVA